MSELKPCPFCGAKTEIKRTLMADGKTIKYFPKVRHKTGCQLQFAAFIDQPTTKRAAIKKWNRRTQDSDGLKCAARIITKSDWKQEG